MEFQGSILSDSQRAHVMTTQTTTSSSTRTDTPLLTSPEVEAMRDRPWILALTRNGHMSEPVMGYVLSVAQRLGYGILAVHVDTMPLANQEKRSRLFAAAVGESVALLKERAGRLGLAVEHLQAAGRVGDLVARLCRARRRIDFVIIDQGIRLEEVLRQSPVPVFPVVNRQQRLFVRTFINTHNHKGVFAMATITSKRHIKNCLLFGSLTAGLYASVFAYQDLVMTWFSKGGVYALLPVATVFAVSYFHGNFTSAFWSALGIEASRAGAGRQTSTRPAVAEPAVAPRRDTRPRVQLNA